LRLNRRVQGWIGAGSPDCQRLGDHVVDVLIPGRRAGCYKTVVAKCCFNRGQGLGIPDWAAV
jgi:hypothetical protein